MSEVRRREPVLLKGSPCTVGGSVRRASANGPSRLPESAKPARDEGPGRGGATARERFRPELDPLPLGLVAAGAAELLAGVRLAGRGQRAGGARELAAVRVAHAGAILASARRAGWRIPLVSSLIAVRLLGLVARITGGDSRVSATRREAALVLWLLALVQLRQEAARAEAWDAPLAGRAA